VDKERNGAVLTAALLAGLLAPAWLPTALRLLFPLPDHIRHILAIFVAYGSGLAIMILAIRHQLRRRAEQAREAEEMGGDEDVEM